jgi:multidrug efflux pump subunit AcrA (membrane-fusion protein)
MAVSAPVYSISDEQRVRVESAAWSRFTAPNDSAEFCSAWLALLCTRVERVRAALVLTGEEGEGAFTVAAAWPDAQRDMQYLGPTAQQALTERRGVVLGGTATPTQESPAQVAYPIEVGGCLFAAIVLDLGGGAHADLQGTLRQIHWASAWLVDHFRQRLLQRRETELARVATLNELMATALQFRGLQPSALSVANELALRLRCDRVSIGFDEAGQVMPLVLSHTAAFDRRSDLVRALGEAMDEVLDLGSSVSFPAPDGDELGALAHAEAARSLHAEAMLSVPLAHEGATIGVITLERHSAAAAFDAEEQRLVRALGITLGPVWALQRENERKPWQRARDSARSALQAAFGPRQPGVKLIGIVLTSALLFATLFHMEYRVSARTVIEGATQLAAVAPFEGYIASGFVRAGDTVKRGQPLAQLDDRDLKLERQRWASEREQASRKYQVAMAAADRGAMAVLAAQMNQAEAQLALAEEKLARATLVAPFDGIVVSGDLSQQIGTPVEQGKLLFEVAPLADYRVVLQVDDRDIARLAKAQRGELVLSSLPDLNLPIIVTTITPVATQRDGRNVFRVEAQIDGGNPARLRPGMEGVGKVGVGPHSLLWIWTHGFTEWLRLTLWNWVP